jgi:hypothetical protein
MNRRTPMRAALLPALLLVLAGCADAPKTLYMWDTFPRQQYETLLHEGTTSPEAQIKTMEQHAEKARAAGAALPPGFRAHLALMHLTVGNFSAAKQMLQAEKTAFPESTPYMDQLLKRLNAPGKTASKENPA